MSAHRFFLTAPLSRTDGVVVLALSAEDVRHAVGSLRVRPGEHLEVVEPTGDAWLVRVVVAAKDSVSALPIERLQTAGQPDITLVQAVAKGEKMDAIVRQAVEIGASAVRPVFTARSVVRMDARKRADRAERWRRVAKAAAEQSHRTAVPPVEAPVDLTAALRDLSEYDEVFVLWEEASGPGLADFAEPLAGGDRRVAIVIGPEGGLDASEIAELEAIGARTVTLGPSILRTETAAVVALALVLHLMGGLGASYE